MLYIYAPSDATVLGHSIALLFSDIYLNKKYNLFDELTRLLVLRLLAASPRPGRAKMLKTVCVQKPKFASRTECSTIV